MVLKENYLVTTLNCCSTPDMVPPTQGRSGHTTTASIAGNNNVRGASNSIEGGSSTSCACWPVTTCQEDDDGEEQESEDEDEEQPNEQDEGHESKSSEDQEPNPTTTRSFTMPLQSHNLSSRLGVDHQIGLHHRWKSRGNDELDYFLWIWWTKTL